MSIHVPPNTEQINFEDIDINKSLNTFSKVLDFIENVYYFKDKEAEEKDEIILKSVLESAFSPQDIEDKIKEVSKIHTDIMFESIYDLDLYRFLKQTSENANNMSDWESKIKVVFDEVKKVDELLYNHVKAKEEDIKKILEPDEEKEILEKMTRFLELIEEFKSFYLKRKTEMSKIQIYKEKYIGKFRIEFPEMNKDMTDEEIYKILLGITSNTNEGIDNARRLSQLAYFSLNSLAALAKHCKEKV